MNKFLYNIYLKFRQIEIIHQLVYKFKFYFHLKPILNRQFTTIISKKSLKKPKILIPLIETSHYQYLQILIIAKSLQIRGAEIKILVCDGHLDACEIKSIKNCNDLNPCFKCKFNIKNILPFFNFEIVTLNEIKKSIIKDTIFKSDYKSEIDLTQSIEDSVIRYYYGKLPFSNQQVEEVREKHKISALLMLEVASYIDKTWTPDIVLNGMYCYSTWEPFYKYYNINGNRFKSISITQYDFRKIIFNTFELYNSNIRYLRYLSARGNSSLLDFEELILDEFIIKRFHGESDIFIHDNYYDKEKTNIKLNNFLNINKQTRNVFIFTNIYWDIGLSSCTALYDDVVSWVLDTIEMCIGDNSIHLYIKPHPGEVYDSSNSLKGISEIIKDKYPNLPNNITIIEPEFKINTYQLFQFIDLGIIFNGTIGLEMMLYGIPVVSTGKTTHYDLQLAYEPSTKIDYLEAIKGMKNIAKPDLHKVRMFAYFYFIRTLLPFDLTKQVYADDFKDGYTFKNLNDLEFGKNKNLDHLCSCILNDEIVPEIW